LPGCDNFLLGTARSRATIVAAAGVLRRGTSIAGVAVEVGEGFGIVLDDGIEI